MPSARSACASALVLATVVTVLVAGVVFVVGVVA
jgi:hypothetical protein